MHIDGIGGIMTATYATVTELVRFLNIEGTVPSRSSTGAARPDETIGTGDSSTTKFYTDQAYVISNTYSFRYSVSEGVAGTALVETTDYTLNKADGTLTLTGTGVNDVGTDNIYSEYSYCTISLTDAMLQESLDRAQVEIDNYTNTHFSTATDSTADYTQETNEKHPGKGKYDRDYYLNHYPLPNVLTTVSGTAVAIADTTVYVADTSGFPTSGYFLIESDKIQYTGKSSTSFTGCTSVGAAHSTAKNITPYVLEISTTASGSEPAWTVLSEDSEFDMDKNTGKVHVFRDDFVLDVFSTSNPPRLVPNRFRATYIYGHDTIPADIKRLCLMIAAKDLMHTIVKNKHLYGSDGFNPSMIDVDEDWIKQTLSAYASIQSANI